MYYNVHCLHRWSKNILNSTWLYPSALQAAPETDGPGILICNCVTCRWILNLKKYYTGGFKS
jgi:hypothetical protein